METRNSGQILTEHVLCAGPNAGHWEHISDWDTTCLHPPDPASVGDGEASPRSSDSVGTFRLRRNEPGKDEGEGV